MVWHNTISSHQLLKSGLSVSPFLVCWDAWLCRNPPPWWVQCLFPAEHGSLRSHASMFSPLLHPCFLGCHQNSLWNGRQTEVDSSTMVKTMHLTSLAVFLLATWVLSAALLYSDHCSLFTTFSTGTYNTSIFSGTGVQATVPMRTTASSWFLSIFSLQVGVSYHWHSCLTGDQISVSDMVHRHHSTRYKPSVLSDGFLLYHPRCTVPSFPVSTPITVFLLSPLLLSPRATVFVCYSTLSGDSHASALLLKLCTTFTTWTRHYSVTKIFRPPAWGPATWNASS